MHVRYVHVCLLHWNNGELISWKGYRHVKRSSNFAVFDIFSHLLRELSDQKLGQTGLRVSFIHVEEIW